jgi:rubrerythrin
MDPVHFSGKEMLEMALQIEANGERYYTVAAEAAKSERLRDLFNFLAGEEKKHLAYFKKMKQQAEGPHPHEIFTPYIEEASLYLKGMADTRVFTNIDAIEQLAREVRDERDVLNYAIDMEKESLLFYYEFIKGMQESDQPILEELIRQEQEHLKKLSELKQELSG